MRRFFIDEQLPPGIGPEFEINITGNDARHISKILRMTAGDEIAVGLRFKGSDEQAAKAVITKISSGCVTVKIKEKIDLKTEPSAKIWLAQGLPKSDKMDFIVQKTVELGIAGIIPLITQHCVVKYDAGKKPGRLERWQKISREAAKQCGRSYIPPIMPFMSLAELFQNRLELPLTQLADIKVLMLYEGIAGLTLKAALAGYSSEFSSYLLLTGPEGGFSLAEVELCRQQGAKIVSLGSRILRTETAALAAVSVLMYQCGDLGG